MRIRVPHPFTNHDQYFNVEINGKFYFLPWYNKLENTDVYSGEWIQFYDNTAGWLWFVASWYSKK